MPIVPKITLKGYFNDGDVPIESNYEDLIDTMGDMLKSVYDTNDDGKVNTASSADAAPWTGITGKPSTYPPDPHTHDHGNLTGLSDDDHTQYFNQSRGDIRYMRISVYDTNSNGIVDLAEQAQSVAWAAVTSKVYIIPFSPWGVLPNDTITVTTDAYLGPLGMNGTITKWVQSYLNLSPADASNYWRIRLRYSPSDTQISYFDINTYTGAWRRNVETLSYSVLATSHYLFIEASKFGSPGALYLAPPWVELTT